MADSRAPAKASHRNAGEAAGSSRSTVMQDELIRIATRLFQARGIRGVSLQDIADEVGITRAALYHYFDNRDDLLRHVFGDWIRRDVDDLQRVMADAGGPRDQLRAYVRFHIHSLTRSMDLYSLSFSAEGEMPDEVRREFRRFKRRSDEVLRGILTTGMLAGDFAAGDETIIAFAIDGMCNWLWKWYSPTGSKSPEAIADDLIELVLDGLNARNPPVPGATDETAPLQYHARAARFHTQRVWDLLGDGSRDPA